jgi:hypothetical protein
MTEPVVKADGLIWLIVGVFWVIAQIAGAAAKKNQSLRPPVSDDNSGEPPAPSNVEGFAELLRKMAGAEEFRVEPPEHEELPEEKPWKPGEIETLPEIKPLRREIPSERSPVPSAVPEIDIRPKMSALRNSIPSIKLPAMNLSFRGSETSVRRVPDIGRILNPSDNTSLRRAMLSHIIFSPPKALE